MTMIPTLMDKRPPFVRFEEREFGVNHEASERAGRPVPRVIVMACITPHASKDCFEKPAEEWLTQIKQKALRGEYPVEWYNHFDLQFSEWKKGNELPREGTPVQTWQAVTKEQGIRLRACGFTTVEDVAQIPDSGLGVVGLDGRYLRDLARSWMNEAKDKGINAKALADANVRIAEQEAQIARLNQRLEALEAKEEPRRGPGRPRKQPEGEAA